MNQFKGLTKTEILAGGERKKDKRSKVISYGNNQTDGAKKEKPRWFQTKEPGKKHYTKVLNL
jgi:hypothetical protein